MTKLPRFAPVFVACVFFGAANAVAQEVSTSVTFNAYSGEYLTTNDLTESDSREYLQCEAIAIAVYPGYIRMGGTISIYDSLGSAKATRSYSLQSTSTLTFSVGYQVSGGDPGGPWQCQIDGELELDYWYWVPFNAISDYIYVSCPVGDTLLAAATESTSSEYCAAEEDGSFIALYRYAYALPDPWQQVKICVYTLCPNQNNTCGNVWRDQVGLLNDCYQGLEGYWTTRRRWGILYSCSPTYHNHLTQFPC